MKQTCIAWAYQRAALAMLKGMDREKAHQRTLKILGLLEHYPGLARLVSGSMTHYDRQLWVNCLGKHFRSPLGVAAGFDKYGQVYSSALPALGWGFTVIGGVTANAQKGNTGKRLAANFECEALWNRMGFNNPGSEWIRYSLKAKKQHLPTSVRVGLNIGKSADVPIEDAEAVAKDYVTTLKAAGCYPDFVEINISSPNTPGLRLLQQPLYLDYLLGELQKANQDICGEHRHPIKLGLKISPDETDEAYANIISCATKHDLDFIAAVNTTTDNTGFAGWTPSSEQGGFSGKLLKPRALEVCGQLYRELKRHGAEKRVILIGSGGIGSGRDAFEFMTKGGATLCSAYSRWISWGPDFAKCCCKELAEILHSEGITAQQAPGIDIA